MCLTNDVRDKRLLTRQYGNHFVEIRGNVKYFVGYNNGKRAKRQVLLHSRALLEAKNTERRQVQVVTAVTQFQQRSSHPRYDAVNVIFGHLIEFLQRLEAVCSDFAATVRLHSS